MRRVPRAELPEPEKRVLRILDRFVERNLFGILRRVCSEHHVTHEEVVGVRRHKAVSKARHALWLALHDEGLSWPQVAEIFERRHDNIIHAARKRSRSRQRVVEDIVRWLRRDKGDRLHRAALPDGTNAAIDAMIDRVIEGIEAGLWKVSPPG